MASVKCSSNNDTCTYVHCLTDSNLRCDFVQQLDGCQLPNQSFPYMWFLYCLFSYNTTPVAVCLLFLWLVMLFIGLGVIADDFLCPALLVISKTLRLSHNVAGVTFLALGNGSPDIFSAIAGLTQERMSLVIGQLIGGGIFVTTVVVGSICILKNFQLNVRPFLRDVIFYMGAVYWIFYVCYTQEITLGHAVGFLVYYCCYILVVIVGRLIYQKYFKTSPTVGYSTFKEKGSEHSDTEDAVVEGELLRRLSLPETSHRRNVFPSTEHLEKADLVSATNNVDSEVKTSISPWEEFFYHASPVHILLWPKLNCFNKFMEIIKIPAYVFFNFTVPVVDHEVAKNNWCRILNIIHCITSPMFILFATRSITVTLNHKFPLWVLILLISIMLATIVYFTSEHEKPPSYHWLFGYFGFIVSVAWIYMLAREVTVLLKAIGVVFKMSDAILGSTFLAWGNSIGDLISGLSVAKQGFPRMSFSACFGGPLSTLMLGFGISCVIHIIRKGESIQMSNRRLTYIFQAVLMFSLVSTLFIMIATRYKTKVWYGIYLITIYLIFLCFMIGMEMRLIG